jgi:hypothetical protein
LEKNIDPQTVLGIKNIYSDENQTEIETDTMTIFEYVSTVFGMILKGTQLAVDSNIKIGKEINVNVNSNDISSFFKMASSINLRRLAIENGVKDVSESHS